MEILDHRGYEVEHSPTGSDVLDAVESRNGHVDLVLLDVMMNAGRRLARRDTFDGTRTGLVVGRLIKEKYPEVRVVGLSVLDDSTVATWFQQVGNGFINKHEFPSSSALADRIEAVGFDKLGGKPGKAGPKSFIVHGHDQNALYQLKNYVQNVLKWPEPVVLRERPNLGRTVIEKFEEEAGRVDVVFALLTPDDKMAAKGRKSRSPRRARQNVIFELGFFFGKLQRRKATILVLHAGPTELPSDINGIGFIDISNGIESAGEEIRRELEDWLDD